MKEKRFYVVSMNNHADIRDMSNETFMEAAESDGTVFTEVTFAEAFNHNFVSASTQFLRIIDVEM